MVMEELMIWVDASLCCLPRQFLVQGECIHSTAYVVVVFRKFQRKSSFAEVRIEYIYGDYINMY
jgi:hypothetical protein